MVGVGELAVEPPDRPVRAQREPGGRGAHRDRQPSAAVHQRAGGLGLPADPLGPEEAGEQLDRGLTPQRAQLDEPGAVHDEAGEPVARGHQHQAPARGGQEETHLGRRHGVVEHDDQPPPGRRRAEQGDLLLQARRDPFRGDAERAEEAFEHLPGAVLPLRRESAQIGIELTVGKASANVMQPVERQRALAHPAQSCDHDEDRRLGRPVRLFQHPAQLPQLRQAVDEDGWCGRELGRHRMAHLPGDRDPHIPVDGPGLHHRPLRDAAHLVVSRRPDEPVLPSLAALQ